jgi:hypothetical protein
MAQSAAAGACIEGSAEPIAIVTSALIAAAMQAAHRDKAPALEAYPLDAELTPSSTSTGYASIFARAGFKTVARRVPPRPIMRHDLS